MRPFFAILRHDWHVAQAQGFESLLSVMFFLTITALFPLASDANPAMLQNVGVSVLWMAVLLSLLLALDSLFSAPARDGSLHLILKTQLITEWIVLAKIVALWALHIVPLLLALPLVALWYGLTLQTITATMLSLLLATPMIILIGAFGAALSLKARRRAAMNALITLPLASPILIFGAAASITKSNDAFFFLMILLCLLPFPFLWMTARILEDNPS